MEAIASSMSVILFLANIIPGLLYLYVLNEFARLLHWRSVDVAVLFQNGQSAPGLLTVIVILLASLVVAQLLEPVAKFVFLRFSSRKDFAKVGLELVQEKNKPLKIKFESGEFELLYTILVQRNAQISRNIEHFQAQSLMFRHLSFGLLLFSILEFINYFSYHSVEYIVAGFLAFWMCWIAHRRSNKHRIWFFERIFEASMDYGSSLEEVVKYRWGMNRESKVKTRRQ